MSLSDAYDFIVTKTAGFDATLSKVDENVSVTVKMARANRNRKLEGIENTSFIGTEYRVSKKELDRVSYGIPQVGDRIDVTMSGLQRNDSVTEVIEQIFMGNVIGYVLRVG